MRSRWYRLAIPQHSSFGLRLLDRPAPQDQFRLQDGFRVPLDSWCQAPSSLFPLVAPTRTVAGLTDLVLQLSDRPIDLLEF